MKKVFLLVAIICTFGFGVSAQKFAYVNTDYILDNIPEYADSQTQLDELSIQWQKEIEVKFAEIDKMYKNFQNEAVLLPEDMKKKREDDIIKKEKALARTTDTKTPSKRYRPNDRLLAFLESL
jgi:outer membrane protein